MTLDAIQAALAKDIQQASWAADNQIRGEMVERYRRYQDGDHDAQMTAEMKAALRIGTRTGSSKISGAPFNSNQMDDVITTMTDRLTVEKIEGDNETATKWATDVMDENRADALFMDVNEGALRDGNTYMLCEYDPDEDTPHWSHELAWDGSSGMLVIHKSTDKNELACAIKVWFESKSTYADTMRVNMYYPGRIERYISAQGSATLAKFLDPDDENYPNVWPLPHVMPNGEPIGVPVIQFRNRSRGKGGYGQSELETAIPLQDALNRTLHSMVMTAELSAFPVMVAKGFAAPPAITPGMVINIGEDGLSADQQADMTRIPGSDLTQYINMAEFFIGRIEAVTRTPSMNSNSNLSGEAMKQSEIKLLGKVRRFQVTAGNSYEDLMTLSARIQEAYGIQSPPANKRWRTRWADAELRNDTDTVTNAVAIKDIVGQEQTIRNLAPVYKWDEEQILQIIAEAKKGQNDRLAAMVGGFNAFPKPVNSNGNSAGNPALNAQNGQPIRSNNNG